MEGNYQYLPFKAQGRYAILGSLSSDTSKVLFVFHGQGQLARYFIQKFKPLITQGYTVIAPEGLHHYYLQGFSGRVGASWMTSENRLVAIANYISFLDRAYQDVKRKASPSVKLHLLGFSQGTATASRWIEQSKFDFEQLILWGGALPPDLNKEKILGRMKNNKLIQVIGKKDPYMNTDKINELKGLVNNYQLFSDYRMYEGGHDIEATVLNELF